MTESMTLRQGVICSRNKLKNSITVDESTNEEIITGPGIFELPSHDKV